MADFDEFQANFAVVGVGGMGSNQVNRLFNSGIQSATTIAMNTDAKHLGITNAHRKLLLGKAITRGLGAGGYPEIAAKAAEASAREIEELISGYDLVFVCAGMGGGTGGGAASVVAKMAREQGSMVVSFVTYPFALERSRRKKADWSLQEVMKNSDTTIIIENDRLLSFAPNATMTKAFEMVDNITVNAVRGITDAIKVPSLINLDFADLKAVMKESGAAVISVGVGQGSDMIGQAVKSTLAHPLMGYRMEGAKSAFVHVAGSEALSIENATRLAEGVTSALDERANVIFGARVVPGIGNSVQVMSIVTGITPMLGEYEVTMLESKKEQQAIALENM